MTTTHAPPPGLAYVNWGRWVADCPRQGCANALALERGQAVFECAGRGACGLVTDVEWPPNVWEIERFLAARPIASTRNWLPGETIHDLLFEGAAHGVLPIPAELLASASRGPVLQVIGDLILADVLAPALVRAAIGTGA
jgi:hypothetical protein